MAEEVMNNKQIILKHYVEGYPKESDMEFKNNNIKLNVQEGSNVVILKNLYLSCDHYMRSHMSKLEGSYFQVLTEYILVSITSAVTVTIAGVVKEAVTILVAVFYFHDDFTWMKGFGLMTIMFGVSLFNWYKYDKIHKGSTSEDETAGSPLGNAATKYVILEEMEDQDHGP